MFKMALFFTDGYDYKAGEYNYSNNEFGFVVLLFCETIFLFPFLSSLSMLSLASSSPLHYLGLGMRSQSIHARSQSSMDMEMHILVQ